MALNTSDIRLFRQSLTQALRQCWVLFLIEGLVLVLLGVFAILAPMVAAITVATLIAWVFLISGVAGVVTTFMAHNAPGFWWSLLSAVIGVVAGIMLLGGPILEDVSLTLLLVVFLNIEGLAWCGYALEHRKQLSGPWTWMLVSGIVDLILAFVFLSRLPDTAAWSFGPLVGTSMLFGGASIIAMAVHARSIGPSPQETTKYPPGGCARGDERPHVAAK
jgi:uncharacterized membrane protein HdeD (DUF308 family)